VAISIIYIYFIVYIVSYIFVSVVSPPQSRPPAPRVSGAQRGSAAPTTPDTADGTRRTPVPFQHFTPKKW
jgi:hypothetical protein